MFFIFKSGNASDDLHLPVQAARTSKPPGRQIEFTGYSTELSFYKERVRKLRIGFIILLVLVVLLLIGVFTILHLNGVFKTGNVIVQCDCSECN